MDATLSAEHKTHTQDTDEHNAAIHKNAHPQDGDVKVETDPVIADNAEDDSDEEDDEDFDIDSANKDVGSGSDVGEGEDDGDEYIDVEDKKEIAKYSSIESSEGGLIKTRRQRQEEEEQERKQKKVSKTKSTTSDADINSIWAEMKGATSTKPTIEKPVDQLPKQDPQQEGQTVKITRTYEFAGKQITEEKEVDVNSEEAKAHLNSTKITPVEKQNPSLSSNTPAAPGLRRKRKRASLLDAVISNSSSTKLSTLEKSRLDWATYVDKNKISDELKYKNKGGFLEKQDFLNRVDSRRDDMFKEAKSKQN